MKSRRVVPEVGMLLAACRWPVDAAAIAQAAAHPIDWTRFVALARRHRVDGLVHHSLRQASVAIPDAAAGQLSGAARRIATNGLRLAVESLRLIDALRAAGTPALILKGAPLAMLAYGSLSLKMAWDIDLLVPADRLAEAAAILDGAGYICALPGGDQQLIARWHGYSKESVWRGRSGIHVELHTALVDDPGLLPGLDARSPAQIVAIAPGLTLPTLADDALFAYLCVHGADSGWWRLKWLADVNALLSAVPMAGQAALLDYAETLGAGRAAGEALLLCRRNLGLKLDCAVERRLIASPMLRHMVRIAERVFLARDGYDDPSRTITATLPIHLHGLLMLPDWRRAAIGLRRKLRKPPPGGNTVSPLRRRWRLITRRETPQTSPR